MTDHAKLERRYGRLVALFYPRPFRRGHEQELLAVLMAAAAEGQTRPGWRETLNLFWGGLVMRLRVAFAWEYERRRVMIVVRTAVGIWLLVLTGLLYAGGRSMWWALLLVPFSMLHFFLVYRLSRPARH
jgi:hypothetical protein